MPCSGSAESTVASHSRTVASARSRRWVCPVCAVAMPASCPAGTLVARDNHPAGRAQWAAAVDRTELRVRHLPQELPELPSTSPPVTHDPEVAAEQTAVTDLYRRLDAARELAVTRFRQALAMPVINPQSLGEREAAARFQGQRITMLDAADHALVIGRLDRESSPQPLYIGRIGLAADDPAGDPALVDWRGPGPPPLSPPTPRPPGGRPGAGRLAGAGVPTLLHRDAVPPRRGRAPPAHPHPRAESHRGQRRGADRRRGGDRGPGAQR